MLNIFKNIFNSDPFKDQIHEPSGIPIKFENNEAHFPAHWKSKEVNGQLFKVQKSEVSKSSFLVRKALDKYPADFLQKHLNAVHIFGRMMLNGFSYGGTHTEHEIYIANRGYSQGFTASYLETVVHHEFSSILLQQYPTYINRKKWNQISEQTYTGDGADALRNDKTEKLWDEKLHQLGFLHEFASSGFRNDFVSIAERLFLGEPRFKKVIETYPLLYEKYKMAIAFYYLLDDRLTPKYFREIHF